jgi:hypothetical protein
MRINRRFYFMLVRLKTKPPTSRRKKGSRSKQAGHVGNLAGFAIVRPAWRVHLEVKVFGLAVRLSRQAFALPVSLRQVCDR